MNSADSLRGVAGQEVAQKASQLHGSPLAKLIRATTAIYLHIHASGRMRR
jgi:hypothetical protein